MNFAHHGSGGDSLYKYNQLELDAMFVSVDGGDRKSV